MITIKYILRHYKSVIIAIIILSLSVISTDELAPKSISSIPNIDKIVHFLLYTGFSLFLFIEFNRPFVSVFPGLIVPLILSILYGGLIEIIQMFIPYRSADIIDFLFDIGGTITGMALFFLWRKIRY